METVFQTVKTAGDGHCLLYAVLISWYLQLQQQPPPSLHELKCVIFLESLKNRQVYMEYLHDISTNTDYAKSVTKYLLQRDYNNTFGDLVPVILANALSKTIRIKNVQTNNEVNDIVISPMNGHDHPTIVIHRAADHYSGVNIIDAYNCISDKPSHGVTKATGDSNSQKIIYTRSELMSLNSSLHKLRRPTRKSIFKNRIWMPALYRGNSNKNSSIMNNTSYTSQHDKNEVITTSGQEQSCESIKKKRELRGGMKNNSKGSAVHSNLVQIAPYIEKTLKTPAEKVAICLLNSQSIKNKDLHIREAIQEHNADLAILTETWLSNSDNDKVWVEACELNNNGLRMDTLYRKDRQGGGVAIVHKSHIKVKKGLSGATRSFEFCEWKVYFKSISIDILAVYRAPYSEKHRFTIKMFHEDFSDFLPSFLTSRTNVIILGDFNIHINDSSDPAAAAFTEMMEALGLTQHVPSFTHKKGNLLDHIYTEVGSNIKVNRCTIGDFVSDHSVISCVLEIPKENMVKKTVTENMAK